MKLSLDAESACALRMFADEIESTIENVVIGTEKVVEVYQSVSETVGPHRQAFLELLLSIKKVQECSAEAIVELPRSLRNTAERIEHYLALKTQLNDDDSDSGAPPPPVRKRTRTR